LSAFPAIGISGVRQIEMLRPFEVEALHQFDASRAFVEPR
jgi:hypothetical protein